MSKGYRVDNDSKALVYPKKMVSPTEKLIEALTAKVDELVEDVAEIKLDVKEIKELMLNR